MVMHSNQMRSRRTRSNMMKKSLLNISILMVLLLVSYSQTHPLPESSYDCVYQYLDANTLKKEILVKCSNIVTSCNTIRNKVFGQDKLGATVGLYHRRLNETFPYEGLARSVSLFHSFLRPLGDALTEETVREVAGLEENSVREELLAIYGNITVATKIYQLIKCDIDIHECIVPFLPVNTNSSTLIPEAIYDQGEVSRRDALLDGLAGDLQLLAADIMTIIPLIHISQS